MSKNNPDEEDVFTFFFFIVVPMIGLRIVTPYIVNIVAKTFNINTEIYGIIIAIIFSIMAFICACQYSKWLTENQCARYSLGILFCLFTGIVLFLLYVEGIPTDPVYAWFVRQFLRVYQFILVIGTSLLVSIYAIDPDIMEN